MKTHTQPAKTSLERAPFGAYEQLADFNHHCQIALGLLETGDGFVFSRLTRRRTPTIVGISPNYDIPRSLI
jgi:hypothetical protein